MGQTTRNTLLKARQDKERSEEGKRRGEEGAMNGDGNAPNFQIIFPPLPFKYTDIYILSTLKCLNCMFS